MPFSRPWLLLLSFIQPWLPPRLGDLTRKTAPESRSTWCGRCAARLSEQVSSQREFQRAAQWEGSALRLGLAFLAEAGPGGTNGLQTPEQGADSGLVSRVHTLPLAQAVLTLTPV